MAHEPGSTGTAEAEAARPNLFRRMLHFLRGSKQPAVLDIDVTTNDAANDASPVDRPEAVPETEEVVRRPMTQGYMEDETSASLLQAASRMIEDRRALKTEIQELRKQLELAERRTHEVDDARRRTEALLRQREMDLEQEQHKVVDYQYKLQQLQEDYEQLLAARNGEYERLQGQIRDMQARYESLSADYGKLRRETSAQVERLEALLRAAEMKNAQLAAESEAVRKENVNLTRRVTEFARQISGILGQAPVDEAPVAPVPIRPTLATKGDSERANA